MEINLEKDTMRKLKKKMKWKICYKCLDLESNTYRKSIKPNIPEVKQAKSIELFDRRLKYLVEETLM
ncbi:MAG: hypothetical protein CM15mP102_00470 [Flavobacteriales bacterium]|nr:MAG: hypothetical protein CM15mP102_00470 [Flavobacteriales bacterium]